MTNNYPALEKILGYDFKDNKIIETVLTHRSYLNEHRGQVLEHNERLEFLGDAVLELIVTDYLYANYKNPEGELTSWRSALVRGEQLSAIAETIELGGYIRMSRGESQSTGKARSIILANALEALIGGLYLDGGIEAARIFVDKYVLTKLEEIISSGSFRDAKSALQELTQENKGFTPEYRLITETGPDHAKQFEVGVWIGEEMIAKGSGNSKQGAERDAAVQALEVWKSRN